MDTSPHDPVARAGLLATLAYDHAARAQTAATDVLVHERRIILAARHERLIAERASRRAVVVCLAISTLTLVLGVIL